MGFYDDDLFGGSRLEDHLSWSGDEVVARITEARNLGHKSEMITCGYCGLQKNFRTTAKNGARWMAEHPCEPTQF
jgi:hypothetical protein